MYLVSRKDLCLPNPAFLGNVFNGSHKVTRFCSLSLTTHQGLSSSHAPSPRSLWCPCIPRISVSRVMSFAIETHGCWFLCHHQCGSWPCVLVCLAAITEYHRLGGLQATHIYFPQLWRLGSSGSRHWQIHCLVGGSCLVLDVHRFAVSSHGQRNEAAL